MKLAGEREIKDLMRRHGLRFSKSLGQNFLADPEVLYQIAGGADVNEEDLVIEIGPGIGVLTSVLSERAGKVVAVEIDRGLVEVMKETLSGYTNIKVVNANILETDISSLIESEKGDLKKVKVIGNLPYYITTPIIMKVLEETDDVESITCMVQKEVADRLMAEPGGRDYGVSTISVKYHADPVRIVEVPKESFVPVPKVDSAVLRLDVRKEKTVEPKDERFYFKIVKASFSQRRKKLVNSLSGAGFSKGIIEEVLGKRGLRPDARAEELSMEDYRVLADTLWEREKDV